MYVPREAKRLDDGWGVFHFSEEGRKRWAAFEKEGLETVFQVPGRCSLHRVL